MSARSATPSKRTKKGPSSKSAPSSGSSQETGAPSTAESSKSAPNSKPLSSTSPSATTHVTERTIVRRWNRPQAELLKATERFVDLEGAVRSGKTTPAIWKIINYAVSHPGIKMLIARWTQDALDMQLRPKFYEECPPELLKKYNAKEEYQEFTNGSIVYIRSLKTSDDGARYAKFTGLTLAVIFIDQPEELPEDVYMALKARLSQIGYPQQMILTPNPPAPNHWLVQEFPEDNSIPGHKYIFTSLYDNRHIIGDQYIAELERDYPLGHAMRRRWIDGRRGLSMMGQPVYGKIFSRHMHVREVEFLADFPLIESWDFGQKHPAVSWHQLIPIKGTGGTKLGTWWNILGEYLGDRQFIDEVVPVVADLRNGMFPGVASLLVCCDPAGAQGQGVRHTNVEVLNAHLRDIYGPGVGAKYLTNSNRPPQRESAIQEISGHMTRLVNARPALLVHPRCTNIIDGLEAGYVYDDRVFTGTGAPNIRRPKKDGYYDHLQNTLEYVALNYGNSPIPVLDNRNLSYKERLRLLQRDTDESDTWGVKTNRMNNRAGY